MRLLQTILLAMILATGPYLLHADSTDPDPDPVRWSTPAPVIQVSAGQTITVVLQAHIQAGWHLYALNEPDGGPQATEIGVAQGDIPDLRSVSETPPVERYDPVMARRLRFHLSQADFSLQLAVPADITPGPKKVHLLARFQACSDQLCLPPRIRSVEATLQVHAD